MSDDDYAPLPLDPGQPEAWMTDAACTDMDPDMWFADKRGTSRQAKRICRECPVQAQCLQHGLREEFGVFGGLTRGERRRMLRRNTA